MIKHRYETAIVYLLLDSFQTTHPGPSHMHLCTGSLKMNSFKVYAFDNVDNSGRALNHMTVCNQMEVLSIYRPSSLSEPIVGMHKLSFQLSPFTTGSLVIVYVINRQSCPVFDVQSHLSRPSSSYSFLLLHLATTPW